MGQSSIPPVGAEEIADALSLKEALAMAYDHNPQMVEARKTIQAAQAKSNQGPCRRHSLHMFAADVPRCREHVQQNGGRLQGMPCRHAGHTRGAGPGTVKWFLQRRQCGG
ncbi:MAG: hypothetical protein HZA28_07415 [Candidatus Omnitrophica bacterium]|nr:hypothetical protein [Candidatus Omnitrophota bacterium]